MENIYLKKILLMIDKINKMPDEEKVEAIYRLFSYCAYIYYQGLISQKEYIYLMSKLENDPEEELYEQDKNIVIKELIDNNSLLSSFYKKYLDVYNNIFIPKESDFVYNVSIYKEFREFLKYMNCENLYYGLLSKKKISFNSILDHSICINDRYDSYILINESNMFGRYFAMSHEIAHAYENRLLCDRKSYFESTYSAEITSILFNRIFFEFIKESNVLDQCNIDNLINKFEVNYYNFLLQSLFITEVVNSNKYNIYDYEINMVAKNVRINCNLTDHNYAIGSIISLKLLNEWRNNDHLFIKELPELVKSIRSAKLDELINNFDDKKAVSEEIKRLIK